MGLEEHPRYYSESRDSTIRGSATDGRADADRPDALASKTRQELLNLPPSAKLVFAVLRHKDGLTQKELCRESLLSPRTARYALERLRKIGVIDESVHLPDARQSIYSLSLD